MFEKGSYNSASFDLHQTAEHAYKTILLVFSGYCPNEHLLKFLIEETKEFYPYIKNFFPQNTVEEKERFKTVTLALPGSSRG